MKLPFFIHPPVRDTRKWARRVSRFEEVNAMIEYKYTCRYCGKKITVPVTITHCPHCDSRALMLLAVRIVREKPLGAIS